VLTFVGNNAAVRGQDAETYTARTKPVVREFIKPANLLPRKILGVEPLEPGYGKVLVWPRCAGAADLAAVAWARGRVPTVKGPIIVDWRHAADGFHLDLELPPRTSALVRLPSEWDEQVRVDGNPMIGTKREGTVEVEVTESGKHELSVADDALEVAGVPPMAGCTQPASVVLDR
jgi:hypothetical protein